MENRGNIPLDRCKDERLRHRLGADRGSAKREVAENLKEVREGLIDDAMGTILAMFCVSSSTERVRRMIF